MISKFIRWFFGDIEAIEPDEIHQPRYVTRISCSSVHPLTTGGNDDS